MSRTKKTYIQPGMIMSELIIENPALLLMMEHFRLNLIVHNKRIEQICEGNNIGQEIFISISNLYNGFSPSGKEKYSFNDLPVIIDFLKNSHDYYKQEKYPEIRGLIKQLIEKNKSQKVTLIEKFFNDYFEEVKEHLDYEDQVAFPYFCGLIKKETGNKKNKFSVKEYSEHHTDIESKLADLRNLLLKHIPITDGFPFRRKLLFSLLELETDLNIHSLVEESILIPLVKKLEKSNANG